MKATLLNINESGNKFTVTYGSEHYELVKHYLGSEPTLRGSTTLSDGVNIQLFILPDGRRMVGVTEGTQVHYEVETEDEMYDRRWLEEECYRGNQDSKY